MSNTSRTIYAKPTLPSLGAAGYTFPDPTFGSTIVRVTDAATRGDLANASFMSPGASNQNGWNSASTRFYVASNGGVFDSFQWNPETKVATLDSQALKFYGDLAWSTTDPLKLYGNSTTDTNGHTIRQADFSTTPATYTLAFQPDDFLTLANPSYVGSIAAANGVVAISCGGTGQEYHYKIVWYPLATPSAKLVLDTLTRPELGYYTHGIEMDKSGRYVLIYPSVATSNPAHPIYIWDTTLNTVTACTVAPFGHASTGHGNMLNSDSIGTWDAAQWLVRSMLTPDTGVRAVISPVMTPSELYLGEHSSWGNAQAGTFIPHVSGLYRYYDGPNNVNPKNTNAWRAWDDEIVSVQNDGLASTVWRHCHHRSLVYPEVGAGAFEFWYTPRPNVSPDGRWILFTSNWEKTLGDDATEGIKRRDVFIVERVLATPPPPPASSTHQRRGRFHR